MKFKKQINGDECKVWLGLRYTTYTHVWTTFLKILQEVSDEWGERFHQYLKRRRNNASVIIDCGWILTEDYAKDDQGNLRVEYLAR